MTERTRANGAEAAGDKRLIRVLIVDDEESNRTFAERGLRGAGYEVAVASDGREALRVAEAQGPFDLFVTDILMPRMCGDELAQRLRQMDADAKVLYFTGAPDLLFEDGKELTQNEAFVEKPVSCKGLLEAVSLILFGHALGPETEAADVISSSGDVFELVPRDAGAEFAVASERRDGHRNSVGRANATVYVPRTAGTVSDRPAAHRKGTGIIRFHDQGPVGPPLALIGKQLRMRLDDGRTLDFVLCDSGNMAAVRIASPVS
jgi:two-component system, cell cycle response regulator CpdR